MPNRYSDQIYKALDNAGPMKFINGDWQLIRPLSEMDLDISFHDKPDTFPVEVDLKPVDLPLYCIPVDTAKDLRILLDEYLAINQERLTVKERDEEIRHEAEHGEAAMLLGAKKVKYALELHMSKDGERIIWRLMHFPQRLSTTKIGFALLSVYPITPSDGDIEQIISMGYNSKEEVASIAAKHSLPKPLWAK